MCSCIYRNVKFATTAIHAMTDRLVGLSWSNNICRYGHHIYKSMDQPGKVANLARGQLNREMSSSLSPFAPDNLVWRDGFGSFIPRQPAHLDV